MRYFANRLQDFVPGSRIHVDLADWKHKIVHITQAVVQRMPPTFDNCDGGVYVGCAGVAYMFYYLANSAPFQDKRQDFLTLARNYLDVSLSYAHSKKNSDPPTAFFLGGAGPFAVGAMILDDYGEGASRDELLKKYVSLAPSCQPVSYLPSGSDELLVGRAGFLSGCYLLNRKFKGAIPTDAIHKICRAAIHSGREYAKAHKSPCPLMYAYYHTEYLGAVHGLSGILQMLMCAPGYLASDSDAERDVRQCVDYMLTLQQPDGNIVPAMDEVTTGRPEEHGLVHFCHGGPGVVHMFAKAFLVWKETKYLQACQRCGELVWQKGLLRKGPGICHGIAGSGYVFLLLYRLTSDEKHLHRALKFAEFMYDAEFTTGAHTPDTPYSLYEGLAGTGCFLTDLLQPLQAEFPMFDVFSYNPTLPLP